MDIAEIRRENMLALIDGFKTQAQFADAVGTPASYISQLKKGIKPSGARVTMGHDLARQIETELKLPYGYMDTQHTMSVQMNGNTVSNGSLHQNINTQRHSESQLARSGQMCIDVAYYEHADLTNISAITVVQSITNKVPDIVNSPDELFAFPMLSQEMTPMIMSGSLVVADRKKALIPIYDGKIYALKMGNLIRCFYLSQVSSDEIRVYGFANREGEVLKRADFDEKYQIMGGVVWWSNFMEW